MWADNFWIMSNSISFLEQVPRDLIEGAEKGKPDSETCKPVMDKHV